MFLINLFILCYTLVLLEATNPKSVNLALETVLDFDQQHPGNLQLIDELERFFAKLKQKVERQNRRNTNRENNVKFNDTVEKAINTLKSLSDNELVNAFALIKDEFKKYHERRCEFYELINSFDDVKYRTNKYIIEKMDAKSIRKNLNKALYILKQQEPKDSLLNFLNTLYTNNSIDFIKDVKSFNNNIKSFNISKRSNSNFLDIIKKVFVSLIDRYSKMDTNQKKELNRKLKLFWFNLISVKITYDDGSPFNSPVINSAPSKDTSLTENTNKQKNKKRHTRPLERKQSKSIMTLYPEIITFQTKASKVVSKSPKHLTKKNPKTYKKYSSDEDNESIIDYETTVLKRKTKSIDNYRKKTTKNQNKYSEPFKKKPLKTSTLKQQYKKRFDIKYMEKNNFINRKHNKIDRTNYQISPIKAMTSIKNDDLLLTKSQNDSVSVKKILATNMSTKDLNNPNEIDDVKLTQQTKMDKNKSNIIGRDSLQVTTSQNNLIDKDIDKKNNHIVEIDENYNDNKKFNKTRTMVQFLTKTFNEKQEDATDKLRTSHISVKTFVTETFNVEKYLNTSGILMEDDDAKTKQIQQKIKKDMEAIFTPNISDTTAKIEDFTDPFDLIDISD